MDFKQFIGIVTAFVFSTSTCAFSVTGHSNYPLKKKDKLISIEATGITSEGGGIGLQSRYTYKPSRKIIVDMGLGTSTGERDGRIFANAEYEIYPDYMRQPKFALQVGLQSNNEYKRRKTKLLFSPIISKGFNVRNKEVFPFIAVPAGIALENNSNTYKSFINVNLGLTGKLPFKRYEHLLGTIEGSINLQNSYSGILLGISYPML